MFSKQTRESLLGLNFLKWCPCEYIFPLSSLIIIPNKLINWTWIIDCLMFISTRLLFSLLTELLLVVARCHWIDCSSCCKMGLELNEVLNQHMKNYFFFHFWFLNLSFCQILFELSKMMKLLVVDQVLFDTSKQKRHQ